MATPAAPHPLVSRWLSLPGNFRGILWLTLGTFLFTVTDVFVKMLGRKFDPMELSLLRYTTGMIVLAPAFMRMGWAEIKTERIGLHLLRMVIAFAAQLGIFVSVIYLPLADATAFMFSKPLFTTIVAVFILSEVVSRARWIATVVGFIGVLIMMRPGAESIDPVVLVAVGSAMTFTVANVLIRLMSVTEPPNRILFYYHIGGILVFLGPAIWVWRQPVGIEWVLIAGIGVVTTAGMVCFVRGFAVGEANAVGPSEYLRLIYAALFGYFLFAEIPSVWTGVGAAVIVGCTYYIARSESRGRR